MRMHDWQVYLSFVASFVITLLGGWDTLIYALFILIILDYLTGVAAGVYQKKISSAIGFRGIIKKFIILTLVALAVILDSALNTDQFWRTAAILFFAMNEAISIIENAERCDVRVPKFMKEMLLKERDKRDGENNVSENMR